LPPAASFAPFEVKLTTSHAYYFRLRRRQRAGSARSRLFHDWLEGERLPHEATGQGGPAPPGMSQIHHP